MCVWIHHSVIGCPGPEHSPQPTQRAKGGPGGLQLWMQEAMRNASARKLYSVNPSALYLYLLISHNILIKSSWWETTWEEMKKRRANGDRCFLSPSMKFPNLTCFRWRKERREVKRCISKETSVLKSSNPFIKYSKYAMLCSARVIPEFCSSPLGHQLWFSTVNKHDVVLIAIAQTGIFFFFYLLFPRTCADSHLCKCREQTRNTAPFTSQLHCLNW